MIWLAIIIVWITIVYLLKETIELVERNNFREYELEKIRLENKNDRIEDL